MKIKGKVWPMPERRTVKSESENAIVEVLCLENPACDLVIGDVERVRCKCDPDSKRISCETSAVITKAK